PVLKLNGAEVQPMEAVKLVGVWLDENLTFKQQAAAAQGRGHEWLAKFRRIARVSGGVGPGQVRRLYSAICVPRMLYAAEVWLAPVRQRVSGENRRRDGRAAMKKLTSIQMKAARMIAGGMVSSPADLLDAHADLLPINLVVDKILHRAAVRYASIPESHPLHEEVRKA
ncbi:hypothetical protein FB45DRAFT_686638, partial [Roridomyces roridus]